MITPASAPQSTESSLAFLSSPSRRLEKVTLLWTGFSIRRICTFPLTIVFSLTAPTVLIDLADSSCRDGTCGKHILTLLSSQVEYTCIDTACFYIAIHLEGNMTFGQYWLHLCGPLESTSQVTVHLYLCSCKFS
jgi:hypothetical protein